MSLTNFRSFLGKGGRGDPAGLPGFNQVMALQTEAHGQQAKVGKTRIIPELPPSLGHLRSGACVCGRARASAVERKTGGKAAGRTVSQVAGSAAE